MRPPRDLVIGSRGSRLALRQAVWVKDRIEAAGRQARIEIIRTSGDRFAARPLAAMGGKGVFVKEIEDALLAGTIDLAVHSFKDLPTSQPEGLTIACVPEREDPRDMLLAPGAPTPADLPPGAVIGTGSPRRSCQMLALRPDLQVRDLRGNVDTRIARLGRGDYDAILLAVAGVRRLGIRVEGTVLDFDQMVPAVGQGAMAVETRARDEDLIAFFASLQHAATAAAVSAERAFLRALGGGCQAPIAAIGEIRGGRLRLRGVVADVAGSRLLREAREGPAGDSEGIGAALAQALLDRGAADLVRRFSAPLPEGP
ncbi:MAG: hydroxymethylbilane synthase [Acidobacteria bacterium]|nr:hydroxymethylbilane synthase [Acidobacteriota bacterium]